MAYKLKIRLELAESDGGDEFILGQTSLGVNGNEELGAAVGTLLESLGVLSSYEFYEVGVLAHAVANLADQSGTAGSRAKAFRDAARAYLEGTS